MTADQEMMLLHVFPMLLQSLDGVLEENATKARDHWQPVFRNQILCNFQVFVVYPLTAVLPAPPRQSDHA